MDISKISTLTPADKNTKIDSKPEGFSDMLNKALSDLNDVQEKADKAVAELATGEIKDLHQAAIAISKAETSMKLMLEVRNKAINAYKEISRTQL